MLNRHEGPTNMDVTNREMPRDVASQVDRSQVDRPLADREVPLPGLSAEPGSADVVHQWLDGEVAESDARRADARQVEFWKRVDSDADRLRRMKTPSHVAANIMAALPPLATDARTATATTAFTEVTPVVHGATGLPFGRVAIIGAAMLALGIVIGRLF